MSTFFVSGIALRGDTIPQVALDDSLSNIPNYWRTQVQVSATT
jgi:hypothetical protein